MATYTRTVHTAAGGELLISVTIVVGTTFAYSATNYWSIVLRHRNEDQTYGEKVGSTLSLATRTLTAREPATIFDTAGGIEMEDGDEIVATITSTGSPALLDNPRFIVTSQRIAR
jgi:hypothetical protein